MKSCLIAFVSVSIGVISGVCSKTTRERADEFKAESGIYSADFAPVVWKENDGYSQSGSVLSFIRSEEDGRKAKIGVPVEAIGGRKVYVSGYINGVRTDMVIELHEAKEGQ